MAEKEESNVVKDGSSSKTSRCQTTTELTECLKSFVRDVLNNVTDQQFVSIYKACYKEFEKKDEIARPALSGSSIEGRKYHSQFNEMIMKSTFRTIEETILNMNNKLEELEELKSAQINSSIHWRPPGNALQHMTPFEYISNVEEKKELQGKIEREEEVLNILKSRLTQKRNKAREMYEVVLLSIGRIQDMVTTKITDEQPQRTV